MKGLNSAIQSSRVRSETSDGGACPVHGEDYWELYVTAGYEGDPIEYCRVGKEAIVERRMVELRRELSTKGFNYSVAGERLENYQRPIIPSAASRAVAS